jgi:hypothetical protein
MAALSSGALLKAMDICPPPAGWPRNAWPRFFFEGGISSIFARVQRI